MNPENGHTCGGTATVVKNAGSHFLLSRLPQWDLFPAVLRGKVRLGNGTATNPVAVGDKVRFTCTGSPDETHPAVITEVMPRRNYLIRRSTNLSRQSHVIAANLDQVLVTVSLYFPEIKLPFLDRILVTCEVYGIPAVILLNKVDMYGAEVPDQVEDFVRIYSQAGYPVIRTSAASGEGIATLKELCKGKLSLFTGESGVGKSSLIKALDPSLNPKTGLISESHLQGKHTTSLYEMYRLDLDADPASPAAPTSSAAASSAASSAATCSYAIDAPGLRGFGLVDMEKDEIYRYFPEMLRVADDCHFVPCTHTHEPDCAVKAAVEDGRISAERYNSYLGMLEDDKKFR